MPEFFIILIKVNIALVLFCLGYYLVLRKLTFYTLNRAYLITGILFSSAYPFIDLSALAQQHREIVAPVQNVVIIWKAPAENLIKQAAYWNWLEIAFWTGVAVFAARLLFQMVSLYKIHARSAIKQINGQAVRVVNGDIGPFSFWKSIYVNPEKLSPADLKNVLAHEQVHVDEWHTLDILLTEISVIFYWFNPGIWMMKRAVRENIEFITDRKILQKGLDSKAYQYSLLNITFNQSAPAITSNFNFSTLKKRIQMMNAKRSSNLNLTRYAFLVPVVVVCLFTFSLSKAEVVKSSPAFKAVAEAVKKINKVVLNHDTVPATTRTVTGTVTIKKGVNGTTKVITLKGADVNNFTVEIDSPRIERQTVTITGKRPGQKDSVITFTIAGGPLGTYNSIDFNGAQTYNSDSATLSRNKMLNGLTTYNSRKTAYEQHVTAPEKATAQTINGLTFKGDTLKTGKIRYYANALSFSSDVSKPSERARADGKNVTYTTSDDKVRTVVGYARPTKSTTGSASTLNKVYKVVEGTAIQENSGLWRVTTTDPNGNQVNPVQPLFIVDGKEVNQNELKSFEGTVVYLNGNNATEKYGAKGKNGVVVITTKKEKK
nr:M56 family metallopeptidase [uncultured Mucilaginibacter sp.]